MLNSGECLKVLKGHLEGITSITVFSDEIIISGSHSEIKVWDIESGTCLRTFLGHSSFVRCIIKLSDDQDAVCFLDLF